MSLNEPPFRKKGKKARNKAFKECVDLIYYSAIDLDSIVSEIREEPSNCVYDKIYFHLYMFDLLDTRKPENAPLVSFCIERILWKFSMFLEVSKEIQKEFSFFLPYCLIPEPELPGIQIGVFLSESGIDFLLNNHHISRHSVNKRTKRHRKKEYFLKKYNILTPEDINYNFYSNYYKDINEFDGNYEDQRYYNIFWRDFYKNGELSSEVPFTLRPLP
ncbi:hypothetical protein NQF86_06140 [Bombella sp. TMW 2.2543]|uniref:Uncharacterized protein n=1 Tax=Bombella pluederhausensis TaxID=2967336 RepID=A0ABT3WIU2_9PROT|nr:hypothetical protein [Bombella pluederhausensis]MCX5618244.1 hypothetical protein [Bombella pluederhausensis]